MIRCGKALGLEGERCEDGVRARQKCFTFFDRLTGFYLNDRYPEYQQKTNATLSESAAKLKT
jgi:hypothetical protein